MTELHVESEELAQAAAEIRAIVGRLTRRLRQLHVDGDLTLPQTSVLARLERDGPSTAGELAASERISAQSMGSTLSALEARGLVSRKADPADGRKREIVITPQGRKVMLGVWQVKHKKLEEALRVGFSSDEQRAIIDALPLLDRLTGMLLQSVRLRGLIEDLGHALTDHHGSRVRRSPHQCGHYRQVTYPQTLYSPDPAELVDDGIRVRVRSHFAGSSRMIRRSYIRPDPPIQPMVGLKVDIFDTPHLHPKFPERLAAQQLRSDADGSAHSRQIPSIGEVAELGERGVPWISGGQP
jgi:DNA-binding MarR family transcriptional regulator